MVSRLALVTATALAASMALVLALAPADWLSGLLGIDEDDATSFLLRRYAVSATLALAVCAGAVARRLDPQQSVLVGFAVWFAVQGLVAIVGVASGTVGGLAWLAVFADPAIAAVFLVLSVRFRAAATATRRR